MSSLVNWRQLFKQILCLCLLSTALAEEKNYDVCHEKFWEKATPKDVPPVFISSCEGETDLMYAVRNGKMFAIEDILNKEGRSALTHAARNGNHDVIETLVEQLSAYVNTTNPDGWTALMYAARNGYLGVIEALARLGADVNATNNDGNTAWDLAKNDETRDTLLHITTGVFRPLYQSP